MPSRNRVSINIDVYICNGCGSCESVCPEIFKMNEVLEKADLLVYKVPLTEALEKAVAFCPEQCIEILLK